MGRKRNSHDIDRVFVKDLKYELRLSGSEALSIHKTNFEDWVLELSAYEEQLYYFEDVYSIYESFNREGGSEKYWKKYSCSTGNYCFIWV